MPVHIVCTAPFYATPRAGDTPATPPSAAANGIAGARCLAPAAKRRDELSRNIFTRHGFIPITPDDYQFFKQFETGSLIGERSATMICSWAKSRGALYACKGTYTICVFFNQDGSAYFIILSKEDICRVIPAEALIKTLYELKEEARLSELEIRCVDEAQIDYYKNVQDFSVRVSFNIDESEYLFYPSDILSLTGHINAPKRQRLARCKRAGGLFLQTLTKENANEMLAVEEAWCKGRNCEECAAFCGCEALALDSMIRLFDPAIHSGFILYNKNGEVTEAAGYVVGEKRADGSSFAYFGKSVAADFFAYLLYSLASSFYQDADEKGIYNIAEDMGSKGLRLFKSHLGNYTHLHRYKCGFFKQ